MEVSVLFPCFGILPMTKAIQYKYLMLLLSLLLTTQYSRAQYFRVGEAFTVVSFQADKKIFPCKWRKKKTDTRVTQVLPIDRLRTLGSLQKAVDKYPAWVIKKHLKIIYVVGTLTFNDVEYGGTYYKNRIYIANDGLDKGFTNEYIEGRFHHEFSSILLKKQSDLFNVEAWIAANPADFEYGNGGIEALENNHASLTLDPNLYSKGFLNEYSMASYEEDFNCIAEYIFMKHPGFWQAWEASEIIRRKTDLLIEFYYQIDPVFTLDYFHPQ